MPKYFIYARKSSESEDRQVLSIESQIAELQKLAKQHNLEIAEVLTESRSAKEPGRPVFNSLIQKIYKGEASGVICWKLDRLARNPVDGGSIIWAIKQHNLRIVTPTQTYSQQEDNTILMYIEFGMAQKYIDDLSRNVKRGIKTKLEKGWFPSVAPLGYLNNRVMETSEKTILPDPERFKAIRRMWDLMLTGSHSPMQILEVANKDWCFRTRQTKKQGGTPLSRSTLYKIFTSPFYYGYFEYPIGSDLWYKGNHTSMITKEEYDKVQVLLGRKGKPRPQKHIFAFTGMIRCGECGAIVTAEEKYQIRCTGCGQKFSSRNRDKCPKCNIFVEKMFSPIRRHYVYYHCTKMKDPACTQKSVEVNELEKQIDEYLSRIEISKGLMDWTIKLLQKFREKEIAWIKNSVQSQQKAYQNCVKQIDNLVTLKTSPLNAEGAFITEEEYLAQRIELLKEKSRLQELLSDADCNVDKWLESSENTFKFACHVREWFKNGDRQRKREILLAVASNLTLIGKKLSIQAHKPFLILEKSTTGIAHQKSIFEPKKNGLNKRKTEALASVCPRRLGDVDDVRTYEEISPTQQIQISRLVDEVLQFFKTTKEYIHIPVFEMNDDDHAEENNLAA